MKSQRKQREVFFFPLFVKNKLKLVIRNHT